MSKAIAAGWINDNSSSNVARDEISRNWRHLLRATRFSSPSYGGRPEREIVAARIIISALRYLKMVGCTDVERLLNEVLESDTHGK